MNILNHTHINFVLFAYSFAVSVFMLYVILYKVFGKKRLRNESEPLQPQEKEVEPASEKIELKKVNENELTWEEAKELDEPRKKFEKYEAEKNKPASRRRKRTTRRGKDTEKKVLSVIQSDRTMTSRQVSQATNLSYTHTCKVLRKLHKKKKIVLIKKGHGYKYTLPSQGQNVYTVDHNNKEKIQ